MSLIVIYTTHPDKDTADKVAKELLHKRLVACANTYPISSSYWWKDEIVQTQEWVVIFKSVSHLMDKIREEINSNHPYEVPCIVHWHGEANEDYAFWVNGETQDKKLPEK